MTLCPYCDEFQSTTPCSVPLCGGFVCPCSGRCNREERYNPLAHQELLQQSAPPLDMMPWANVKAVVPGNVDEQPGASR
jgi:hypothetical protein